MTRPDTTRIARRLRRTAELLDEHGTWVLRFLADSQPGYPGGGNDATARTLNDDGTPSSPVAQAALHPTRLGQLYDELTATLDRLDNESHHVVTVIQESIPMTEDRVERGRKPTGGDCRACDRYCAGTGEDRLRSGYCAACRMAWRRAGSPDRQAFERDRRIALESPEPPENVFP